MDKNEKISRFILRLGAITFIFLGAYELSLLLNMSGINSRSLPLILKAFGSIWLLCGLLIWIIKPLKMVNTVFMLTTFNIAYILLELFVYLNINFKFKNQFFLISHPFSTYNEVRGYHYTNPVRFVSIINRHVEFDETFKPNAQGYSSNRDYTYKKSDSSVYRIMVLGDSFSDACFLDQSWADALDKHLKAQGRKMEVYSFSYSGNGIVNWENIFRKEILPNYEFDCLVIANFVDDMSRKFNVQILGEKYMVGNFDTIPADKNDFEQHYASRMLNLTNTPFYKHEILDETKVDKRIKQITAGSSLVSVEHKWKKPEPYILYTLINEVIAPILEMRHSQPAVTWQHVQNKYGQNIHKLQWISDTCHQMKIRVILCSIPLKTGALAYTEGMNYPHQQECKLFSEKMKMEYFDGYEIFKNIPKNERKNYWFVHDGHWNSKGSDLFANSISKLFLNQK